MDLDPQIVEGLDRLLVVHSDEVRHSQLRLVGWRKVSNLDY
jgi:hypothetical protein